MNKLTSLLSAIALIFSITMFNSCKKDKSVPVLTTVAVSDITLTTAKSGGSISNDGGAAVTSRGVCWSTSDDPTIGDNKTSDGTGTGSFESELAGLSPGTTYYVRAYATNSEGTSYGNQVTFATSITVPTLTTAAVADITLTTAKSGGDITSSGGDSITARGVCWSTTVNPTVDNSKTTDGDGSGDFVSNMTGLTAGTTYYVRAYATNSAGTSYGNQVTFTTVMTAPDLVTVEVSEITFNSAKSGGTISTNGGSPITAKGVCWSTVENPTIEGSKTENGIGVDNFTSIITGLLPVTTYYVRAYATNSIGTSYGNQLSFTTPPAVPTLTTTPATEVTVSSAKTGGNITNNGGAEVTMRGAVWSLTVNPTIENSKSENGAGSGEFVSNIAGMSPGETYYIRAYATNSAGTGYGNQITINTLVALPSLTTTPVTAITQTTATSGGNISNDGGGTITVRGICWSTNQNPTIANTRTQNGTGPGTFTSNLTALIAGTTYYVRAYATNSAGTAYGVQVSFTTTPVDGATLSTTPVTALTPTTATSGGNITNNGGGTITARGVCWNTSPNPTIANSRTTNGTGNGVFISNITGLTNGTTYYLRAYATNSSGTSYGNELSFITPVADNQGHIYKTVQIGQKVWMAENLKVTRLNDLTEIPNVPASANWNVLSTPAYCVYDNVAANANTYGLLYNWFALNTGQLCPTGWHEPTDAEFNTLEITLGMAPADVNIWGWRGVDQGQKAKSTTGWLNNGNGTNTSGLTVLPGGYRQHTTGNFPGLGILTYFWSSTDDAANGNSDVAWYRRMDGDNNAIYKATTLKIGGKYVRCVKD